MDIRASLKSMHKALDGLTPEALEALEAQLEEELAIVKTMKAIHGIIGRRVEQQPQRAPRREHVPVTDLDKQLRGNEMMELLVAYFRRYGDQVKESVMRHFKELGHDGRIVSITLMRRKEFEQRDNGQWGLTASLDQQDQPSEPAA